MNDSIQIATVSAAASIVQTAMCQRDVTPDEKTVALVKAATDYLVKQWQNS